MRQERRRGIERAQRRCVDLGDDGRVEAVDKPVFEVDRLFELVHGGVRNAHVQEVVRHELEEVEALQLALHPQRRALHLGRRCDHPDLAVERAAGELVVEALERLGAPEERAPSVVERCEVLAQG